MFEAHEFYGKQTGGWAFLETLAEARAHARRKVRTRAATHVEIRRPGVGIVEVVR